jgi:hypothetical protein
MNCTLVAFTDALAVMVVVPETVAPATGEVMETVGAAFLTSGLVTTAQPAQSSASTNIKHNQGTSPGWALDLPMNLVGKLIESFLSFFERPVSRVGPYSKGIPTYMQANTRSGIPLLNRRSVLVQGATCVGVVSLYRRGGQGGLLQPLYHRTVLTVDHNRTRR